MTRKVYLCNHCERPVAADEADDFHCCGSTNEVTAIGDTVAASLGGRCANGDERDHGRLLHAVQARATTTYVYATGAALCGATPGRRSVGWSERPLLAVTCPRCLKKLNNKESAA